MQLILSQSLDRRHEATLLASSLASRVPSPRKKRLSLSSTAGPICGGRGLRTVTRIAASAATACATPASAAGLDRPLQKIFQRGAHAGALDGESVRSAPHAPDPPVKPAVHIQSDPRPRVPRVVLTSPGALIAKRDKRRRVRCYRQQGLRAHTIGQTASLFMRLSARRRPAL